MMYNLQDYITPIVNSHEICIDDNILEISSWALPRINAHCQQIIYSEVGGHSSADIAIIIDLFSGAVFLYMLTVNFIHLMYMKGEDYLTIVKNRWYKITSKNHFYIAMIIPFLLVFLVFMFQDLYFGSPLISLPDAGRLTRVSAMLYSPIGFGAACQVFPAIILSYTAEYLYIFWVIVKEDMTRDRGTS